jgi:phosphate transporter
LEKAAHQNIPIDTQDTEASALLGSDSADPDTVYRRALDHELEKVCSFYQIKELELYGELDSVLKDEETYEEENEDFDFDGAMGVTRHRSHSPGGVSSARERRGSVFRGFSFGRPRRSSTMGSTMEDRDDSSGEDGDENTALTRKASKKGRVRADNSQMGDDLTTSRELPPSRRGRRTSQAFEDYQETASYALFDTGLSLKKRIISLYVSICELKSFGQLNKTGFTKALKKYDKILNKNLRPSYVSSAVDPAYPFRKGTTQNLDDNILKIVTAYARVVTSGDVPQAKRELRLHLREHVVWERNTVWREMIGIERKAQAANMGLRRTLLGGDHDPTNARLQGDEADDGSKELRTPVGRFRCPSWLFSATFFTIVGIVAVFAVLLVLPIMKKPEQQNCLAMLVMVSLLWATEAIPLFVTSLLVPLLVVLLRVVRSDEKPHRRLEAKEAGSYIFSAMWTPVIMLLLGGFAIAAALSKYHIAKLLATSLLSKAGTRPRTVLLTNMFVAMFASMWISNVASPVLCYSIIQVCLLVFSFFLPLSLFL